MGRGAKGGERRDIPVSGAGSLSFRMFLILCFALDSISTFSFWHTVVHKHT